MGRPLIMMSKAASSRPAAALGAAAARYDAQVTSGNRASCFPRPGTGRPKPVQIRRRSRCRVSRQSKLTEIRARSTSSRGVCIRLAELGDVGAGEGSAPADQDRRFDVGRVGDMLQAIVDARPDRPIDSIDRRIVEPEQSDSASTLGSPSWIILSSFAPPDRRSNLMTPASR